MLDTLLFLLGRECAMSTSIPFRGGAAFTKGLATSTTDVSFDSKIPTTTEPTGDGVHDVQQTLTTTVPVGVQAVFYGAGANDSTFTARLIGWKLIGTVWVPTVLAEIAGIYSTVVGVSGGTITDTDRLADTLTLASGYSTANCIMTSPTGNIVAHATVNLDGYAKIEWSLIVGTATNANCLWSTF